MSEELRPECVNLANLVNSSYFFSMSIKWFACVSPETGDDQKRRDGAMNCFKSEHTATIGDESTTPGEENSQSQSRGNGSPAPRTLDTDADADADDDKEQRKRRRRERREAEKRNRAIERELRHTQRLEEKFTHLLILGAHVLRARGTRTVTLMNQTACSEQMSQETRIEFAPSEADVEVEGTIKGA